MASVGAAFVVLNVFGFQNGWKNHLLVRNICALSGLDRNRRSVPLPVAVGRVIDVEVPDESIAKTEATELEGPVVGLIPAIGTLLSYGSYLGSLDTSVGRCWWWFFPCFRTSKSKKLTGHSSAFRSRASPLAFRCDFWTMQYGLFRFWRTNSQKPFIWEGKPLYIVTVIYQHPPADRSPERS